MIYIELTTRTRVRVHFPRNGGTVTHTPSLCLKNTVDNSVLEVEGNEFALEGRFVVLDITLPAELYAGEWAYDLKLDDHRSIGLLAVTEQAVDTREYERTITYKQYE